MIEKMKNVVVYVRELEPAKRFYKEQLGLPLVQESQAIMEFFPGGGPTLGVALAMSDDALKLVGRPTGITLQATELARLCEQLEGAGVEFAVPLERTPWGKWAVVKDPDGHQFALVE